MDRFLELHEQRGVCDTFRPCGAVDDTGDGFPYLEGELIYSPQKVLRVVRAHERSLP